MGGKNLQCIISYKISFFKRSSPFRLKDATPYSKIQKTFQRRVNDAKDKVESEMPKKFTSVLELAEYLAELEESIDSCVEEFDSGENSGSRGLSDSGGKNPGCGVAGKDDSAERSAPSEENSIHGGPAENKKTPEESATSGGNFKKAKADFVNDGKTSYKKKASHLKKLRFKLVKSSSASHHIILYDPVLMAEFSDHEIFVDGTFDVRPKVSKCSQVLTILARKYDVVSIIFNCCVFFSFCYFFN